MSLVLSIFPGIDLLGRAFEEEGYCVVRGPDPIFGGDIRGWHVPSGVFEGVIGGPPCQSFSRLRYINPLAGQKFGNLIPEFERVVQESKAAWFLMENVREAPVPQVKGYWPARTLLLKNRWVGAEQNRVCRFSFGMRYDLVPRELDVSPDLVLLECPEWSPAVLAGGGSAVPVRLGGSGKPKKKGAASLGRATQPYLQEAIRLQGLPQGFLDEAPFTIKGKVRALGEGVPLPLGRAIAKAIRRALEAP